MAGGVVSTTEIVWEQVTVLVQQSVMSQLRVVVCRQGVPNNGVVNWTVIVTFVPQHASKGVGGSKTIGVPHSTVLLGAQVGTGGVVSAIMIVSVHEAVLVQQSTACQVFVTK